VLEKNALTLGFVPLTDCAPLAAAKEKGFFARHGLEVTLSKEPSWANIRDKLALGIFDAAQLLGGMPLANSIGIGGLQLPTVTALSLGLNGNAVTVGTALYRELAETAPEPASAMALQTLIALRRQQGRPPLRLAMVYPYSSHHYLLRYWLASGGIDPDRDVQLCVVPPPQMVAQLKAGHIDGFCVGEPWNTQAVSSQVGRILVSSHQIWNNHPEKVLGVNRQWAAEHPETHKALIKALIEAARWLADPANSAELLSIMAQTQYLGLPEAVLKPSLTGAVGGFNIFHRYAATFPWVSHAEWFLTQMLRWGQLDQAIDLAAVATAVYRPDIYREAAREIGEPYPLTDRKTENRHAEDWLLNASTQPISMGPDRFCDSLNYPGDGLLEYIEAFAVKNVRADWEALRRQNKG
jgi:nitrate/nitrite transport system substrate-binding protein